MYVARVTHYYKDQAKNDRKNGLLYITQSGEHVVTKARTANPDDIRIQADTKEEGVEILKKHGYIHLPEYNLFFFPDSYKVSKDELSRPTIKLASIKETKTFGYFVKIFYHYEDAASNKQKNHFLRGISDGINSKIVSPSLEDDYQPLLFKTINQAVEFMQTLGYKYDEHSLQFTFVKPYTLAKGETAPPTAILINHSSTDRYYATHRWQQEHGFVNRTIRMDAELEKQFREFCKENNLTIAATMRTIITEAAERVVSGKQIFDDRPAQRKTMTFKTNIEHYDKLNRAIRERQREEAEQIIKAEVIEITIREYLKQHTT